MEEKIRESERIVYSGLLSPSDAIKRQFKVTPYRFLVIGFYLFLVITVSGLNSAFSVAFKGISLAYDVPLIEVTMLSISYSLTYIPCTLASIYCFNKYSQLFNFRMTVLVLFIGGWMRQLGGMG
jgi:hypothetical protein